MEHSGSANGSVFGEDWNGEVRTNSPTTRVTSSFGNSEATTCRALLAPVGRYFGSVRGGVQLAGTKTNARKGSSW